MIQDPRFQTFERFAQELIEKIRDRQISLESEWGTLSDVLFREGEVNGIRLLIKEMYEQAKKADE